MKKALFQLLAIVSLLGFNTATRATMVIDSVTGPVTQNEINSFKTFMAAETPPQTPWGALNGTTGAHNLWADGTGGRELEAMGMMYEASGDIAILNQLVHWTDLCVSQRNDLMSSANGGQRVMWTGLIDKVWCPEEPTSAHAKYAGCENEDVEGHIAYCSKLILQNPSLWNTTVPDGNPFGYGVTYLDRAKTYLAKCDEANDEYSLKWFIQPTTHLIRPPTSSAWTVFSENVTAINRQQMFTSGFQRLAEAHELLGDNPARVAQYDAIVVASVDECLNGMIHFPGNPRTANGQTVYKWGYYPTSTTGVETTEIHAEYDMIGVWRAYTRSAYGYSLAPLVPFANTFVNVVYIGSNNFAVNVDGSGGTQGTIYSGWMLTADWNSTVYTTLANAVFAHGWYKSKADIDAGLLFMKNRRYLEFSVSASPASQTVNAGSSKNYTVTLSPLGGFRGAVNFTASGLPSGATATFSSPSVNLATIDSVSTNVTATISTSASTPAGNYTINITGTSGSVVHTTTVNLIVSGTSDFTVSATPSSQTVAAGNSTTYTVNVGSINGFNSAVNLAVSGLPSGATATFNPASVTPAGSATLTITTSSSTPISTSTLTITGTSGSLTHSTTVSLSVTAPPDFTISTTPSSQTVSAGNSTTYTATIGALNGFSGVVNFSVSGLPTGSTATFNPASVTGSGSSTVTVTTSASTPVGSYTLTITGTSGSLAHSATVSLSVTAPPDFTISAAPASQTISAGNGTTYTATIGALNSFSGAVNFSVSGLPAGATASFNPASVTGSGSSTLTVTTATSTAVGSYTLTITGTSGSLTHSATVSLSVTAPPDFTISAAPASQTVFAGNGTTYTATIGALNGFSGVVNFSVSGLPAGAAASFNPASITGAGNSTLTVTTSASTPVGSYTLTITGTSGSLAHSTTVSLSVTAPPDFTVSASPSSQMVTAGNNTSYTATIGALNGFSSTVNLSVSGLPTGATASFSPTTVTGSGSSTLTVTTSTSTPAGTYTLTVTGTSGSLVHSATVTLVVNAAVVTWTTVNDTGAGITYSAGWSYSTNRTYGDYNKDVHYTKTNANYAQFTFTGTGVRYITETYSDEGNVDIYIDGVLQATVNCNTATRQAQVVAYEKTGISAGTHTIKIVKSSGTYMLLDAFAYTP